MIHDDHVTLQIDIDFSKLIQWLMLQFGCGDWTKKTKKLLQDCNFNLSVWDDLKPSVIHFLT